MPAVLTDPRTLTRITGNRYSPRGMPSPMWIACHTSESMSRALNLARYLDANRAEALLAFLGEVDEFGVIR